MDAQIHLSTDNAFSTDNVSKESQTREKIQGWLVTHLAELLEIDQEEVEVDMTFDRYGLDSSAAIGLTGDLADWLGTEIEPTLLYEYPTIESLGQYLAQQ